MHTRGHNGGERLRRFFLFLVFFLFYQIATRGLFYFLFFAPESCATG